MHDNIILGCKWVRDNLEGEHVLGTLHLSAKMASTGPLQQIKGEMLYYFSLLSQFLKYILLMLLPPNWVHTSLTIFTPLLATLLNFTTQVLYFFSFL